METTLAYSLITYKNWSFYIAATEKGLCFVGSIPADENECLSWINRTFEDANIVYDEEKMSPFASAFHSYLAGDETTFNFPLDTVGTPFQKKIWISLMAIPYGQTLTYGELAERNGLSPQAARAVGSAVGKNPLLIVQPCHRVVPKSGSPKAFRGGLDMKKALLKLERAHSS